MKKYILLIALPCLMLACNKNEDEKQDNNSEHRIVMNIHPDIPPLSRVTTTSDNSFIFEEGDAIGIFIVDEGSTIYGNEYNYNTKFTKTSDSWNQSKQTSWRSTQNGAKNDVIGYYPYNEMIEYIDVMPITILNDQRNKADLNACDYLWGKSTATLTESNSPVRLTMNHVMTELIFQITLEGEYMTNNGIENLQIFAKNKGNFNLNDGNVTASGERTPIIPYLTTTADDGFKQTYKALILPQEYVDESFISFEIEGKTYSQPLKYNLLQGKYYVFNLNVGQDPNLFLLSEGGIIDNWIKENEDDLEIDHEIGSYLTGDLWPDSQNPVAIVIKARENSNPGILMSLTKEKRIMYSQSYSFINEISEGVYSGRNVMSMMEQFIEMNQLTWNDFPAFEFCRSLGDGWFIPNIEESQSLLYTALWGISIDNWIRYMGAVGEEVSIWTSTLTSNQSVGIGHCRVTFLNGSYYYSIGGNYYPATSSFTVKAFKYF